MSIKDDLPKSKRFAKLPHVDLINDLLYYSDGNLYWRKSRGVARAGDAAGSVTENDGVRVRIDGQLVNVGLIVWIMHHGSMHPHGVRYKDGDRYNNKIENLEPRVPKRRKKTSESDAVPTISFM